MILTRCSYCGTPFRVTPEQLRIRNGQVRCGECDAVFNALDFLEEEQDVTALLQKSFSNHIPAVPVPTLETASIDAATHAASAALTQGRDESLGGDAGGEGNLIGGAVRRRIAATPTQSDDPMYGPVRNNFTPAQWGNERPFSATDAGLADFVDPKPKRATWPFVLLAIPLFFILLAQVLYTYRTPLASNSSLFAALYQVAGVHVPVPRVTELVAIEATDLQADQPNNQLVLLGTLRNQATFNQAWPSLELSLMDATGAILSRRVLQPADYLLADAPPVLAARSELALSLRFSAEGLAAANYRLYVFYP